MLKRTVFYNNLPYFVPRRGRINSLVFLYFSTLIGVDFFSEGW